jgi:hypothetical protein
MPKKKAKSATAAAPKRHARRDPDDAPEITDAMLDRATIVKDGKVVQRGPRRDENKQHIKSDLGQVDRHRIAAHEYDDAPEIGDDFFDDAEIRDGDKLIRRSRPPGYKTE